MGSMVSGASRCCGQHRQCLSRLDSTQPLPPKASDSRAPGVTSVKGPPEGTVRPASGQPRGERRLCATDTGGQPTLAGVQTGGWGGGGNGAHADSKDAHSALFYLGFVKLTPQLVKRDSEKNVSKAGACRQSLCGR